MGLLMVTYPITRFLIEYLRNDEGVFFAGLTISQNISLAFLVGGLVYWRWLSMLPRGRLVDEPEGARDRICDLEAPSRDPDPRMRGRRDCRDDSRHRDVIEDPAEDIVGREPSASAS